VPATAPAPALWASRGGLSMVASPPPTRGKQQLGLCRDVVPVRRCPGHIHPTDMRRVPATVLAPVLWASRGGLSMVASPPPAWGKQQLGLCHGAIPVRRCPGHIPPADGDSWGEPRSLSPLQLKQGKTLAVRRLEGRKR